MTTSRFSFGSYTSPVAQQRGDFVRGDLLFAEAGGHGMNEVIGEFFIYNAVNGIAVMPGSSGSETSPVCTT